MSSDSKLKLTLSLAAKDTGASASVKKLGTEIKALADTTKQESKKAAAEQVRVIRSVEREQRQAAGARARLGIRSEQEIQREIMRTEQAYRSLVNSGKASQRELQRAATVTRDRMRELNAEMGKGSKFTKLMNMGKAGGTLIAGGAAAAFMLKDPLEKRRSFDLSLAYAANTAYSERDVKGRIAGKQELYNAVKGTVTKEGGSRDQALDALNSMIASGTVEIGTAKELLPVIQRASVASGADSNEIAKIAISAMQQYKLKPQEVQQALDKAMAAGQAGQFELDDMAKWLPQAMAATANAGMGGMKDFDVLLRSLQQARITAGSADEGGNNFVNLAAKITSADAVTKFSKAEYIDKKGKKHSGIDLTKSLLEHKEKGENTLDAFMNIVDEYMTSNKQYQQLQKKINAAKNDQDKKMLMEQQASILSGTAVGDLVSDRQALMALLAIKNNKSFGDDVMKALQNANGTINTAHAVVQDTTYAKKQNLDNTKDFGAMESLKGMDETLGDVNQKLADYGNKYPGLGKVIGGTSVAMGALSAAAMAAATSLSLMSFGGFGGKGKLGKLGKAAKGGGFFARTRNVIKTAGSKVWPWGAKAAKGAASASKGTVVAAGKVVKGAASASKGTVVTAGKVVKGAGKLIIKGGKLSGIAGTAIAIGMGGYNSYQIAHDTSLTKEQKKNEQIRNGTTTGGGLAGAVAGGTAGAAIGSVVPGLGTAIGGVIGSILGAIGGDTFGKKIGQELTSTWAPQTQFTRENIRMAQMTGVMPQAGQNTSRFEPISMQPTALAADKLQPAIAQQTVDFQNAMQTNSSEVTARLERINNTLASQQQVIRNEISLNVDGRVIAEQVSERQLQMFGRG